MKKVFFCLVIGTLIAFFATGCGKIALGTVSGTWYGDNQDSLVLTEKGEYTSSWLGDGEYSIDGDTVHLSGRGMADGSVTELKMGTIGGKKILLEKKQSVTYYVLSSDATEAIRMREESVRKEEEERVAEELNALKKDLIGTWEWVGYAGDVTFSEDGTINGTVSGMKPGTYEVIDFKTLKIENADQSYTRRIDYSKDENGENLTFGTMKLVKQ